MTTPDTPTESKTSTGNRTVRRPNIFMIITDDHATSAISAYGSKLLQTPHIDRVAREGMLFRNSFCTNSLCTPSRATILTGQYSHSNGVKTNYEPVDYVNSLTFPQLLQDSGYQTASIGKGFAWQDYNPGGFDYFAACNGSSYTNPTFHEKDRTYEVEGYSTEIITEKSIDWLESRDPDKPFLLICTHPAPHTPCTPADKYKEFLADVELPEPESFNDDYRGKSQAADNDSMKLEKTLLKAIRHWGHEVPEGMTTEETKKWAYQWLAKNYLRCAKSLDDSAGAMLEWFEKNDLLDNTIFIYTSDQGYFLGEHGYWDKRYMYEDAIRIPMVIRYPESIQAGSCSDNMVLTNDLAPTLLDMVGLDVPDVMEGRSFKPLFTTPDQADWREDMYYHFYEYDPESEWNKVLPHYGVRTRRHKLIYFYTIDEWEMYDLEQDSKELVNIYHDVSQQAIISELKTRLKRLRSDLNDTTGSDWQGTDE